jgi:hypothetical protein
MLGVIFYTTDGIELDRAKKDSKIVVVVDMWSLAQVLLYDKIRYKYYLHEKNCDFFTFVMLDF